MQVIKIASSKVIEANGKKIVKLTKSDWEKIGQEYGWLKVESKSSEKSPTEHGFMEECMKKNKDAKDPGAYCASIVDKAKGTTEWRKGPKKD